MVRKVIFFLILVLIPIFVKANVVCNDGTISPTCNVCSRGCCSHHGGCSSSSSNYYDNNDSSNDHYSGNIYGNNNASINQIDKINEKVDADSKEVYFGFSAIISVISGVICLFKLSSKGGI